MPDAQATLDRRAAALGEAVKRLGPWKQVSADVGRTLWKAGPYTLVGDTAGRNANQSIRRTWTLKYGTTVIGRPARLSEGKRDAVEHYADRVTLPEMEAQETTASEVVVRLTPSQAEALAQAAMYGHSAMRKAQRTVALDEAQTVLREAIKESRSA
jgi:hypothetical protein